MKNIKYFSELITEGRFDPITRIVVNDIIKSIKKSINRKNAINLQLPYDINKEEEHTDGDISFNVDLNIKHKISLKDDAKPYFINTALSGDTDNIIMMSIILDPNYEPNSYERIFFKLQEDIRHEIEHITQTGIKTNTARLKTVYGHHKNKYEVPALVQGFYRRAKLEKRFLNEIMIEDLMSEIEKRTISKSQANNLLKIWINYAKKVLPDAKYNNDLKL